MTDSPGSNLRRLRLDGTEVSRSCVAPPRHRCMHSRVDANSTQIHKSGRPGREGETPPRAAGGGRALRARAAGEARVPEREHPAPSSLFALIEHRCSRAVSALGRTRARRRTKIVQGSPKLWANFRALIGIFSQSVEPSLAIWVNPVQFSFRWAIRAWRATWRSSHRCCG